MQRENYDIVLFLWVQKVDTNYNCVVYLLSGTIYSGDN